MVTGKDFFFCYNKNLSDYLSNKGIKYITLAINPNNGNSYSLFYKTPKLQQTIQEYKSTMKNT